MALCCRICLKKSVSYFSIYTYMRKKYLPDVIKNISGVQISKGYEPHAQICRRCAASVLVAENIILQCQESEEYFQYQRLKKNCIQNQSSIAELSSNYKESQTVSPASDMEENGKSESISIFESNLHLPKGKNAIISTSIEKKEFNQNLSHYKLPMKRIERVNYHHAVEVFNCDKCNYSTKTGKRIIEHKKTIHGVYDTNIYTCPHCSQRFSWKPTLYRHIEVDHKTLPADKKYLCNECGRAYMREIHLLEHVKQRHGPRTFKCPDPLCEQTFNRTFTLRRHFITTHTEQTSTRYHCVDCNKYFKVYDQWKYHNEVIHKNEIVYCPHCGYPFRFKEKLDEHISKDVCKRSVVPCSYCQRRFTTKNGLREHVRNIHSIG